ncbi:hypothetical protein EVAR_68901_1 [Eumeta japonica]|uniref:Uncharacterized protein n=1 Tax=Eumeta variegata TaxID=151549 RepID=A0A4C1ZTP4_EUMVA|nr:hypothetical protein EVAR_68901_1 [Eumeta japonica]
MNGFCFMIYRLKIFYRKLFTEKRFTRVAPKSNRIGLFVLKANYFRKPNIKSVSLASTRPELQLRSGAIMTLQSCPNAAVNLHDERRVRAIKVYYSFLKAYVVPLLLRRAFRVSSFEPHRVT